jgi:DNA-3-methyladenine glycosylase II
LCPRQRLTPGAVRSLDVSALRGAGLSRQKAAYAQNVAEAFASRVLTAAKLRRLPDAEVIAAVTAVKGVGRWTAEMLLIFCLERPDVWPVDDLGLRNAVQRFTGEVELPAAAEMQTLGEAWRPYRTCATWYLWRSLEAPTEPAITH